METDTDARIPTFFLHIENPPIFFRSLPAFGPGAPRRYAARNKTAALFIPSSPSPFPLSLPPHRSVQERFPTLLSPAKHNRFSGIYRINNYIEPGFECKAEKGHRRVSFFTPPSAVIFFCSGQTTELHALLLPSLYTRCCVARASRSAVRYPGSGIVVKTNLSCSMIWRICRRTKLPCVICFGFLRTPIISLYQNACTGGGCI